MGRFWRIVWRRHRRLLSVLFFMPTFAVGKAGQLHPQNNIFSFKILFMMEINNKYQIGEKVYFLDKDNKAQCDEVKTVCVYVHKDETRIMYDMAKAPSYIGEEKVFRTDTELRQYVFGDLIEFV